MPHQGTLKSESRPHRNHQNRMRKVPQSHDCFFISTEFMQIPGIWESWSLCERKNSLKYLSILKRYGGNGQDLRFRSNMKQSKVHEILGRREFLELDDSLGHHDDVMDCPWLRISSPELSSPFTLYLGSQMASEHDKERGKIILNALVDFSFVKLPTAPLELEKVKLLGFFTHSMSDKVSFEILPGKVGTLPLELTEERPHASIHLETHIASTFTGTFSERIFFVIEIVQVVKSGALISSRGQLSSTTRALVTRTVTGAIRSAETSVPSSYSRSYVPERLRTTFDGVENLERYFHWHGNHRILDDHISTAWIPGVVHPVVPPVVPSPNQQVAFRWCGYDKPYDTCSSDFEADYEKWLKKPISLWGNLVNSYLRNVSRSWEKLIIKLSPEHAMQRKARLLALWNGDSLTKTKTTAAAYSQGADTINIETRTKKQPSSDTPGLHGVTEEAMPGIMQSFDDYVLNWVAEQHYLLVCEHAQMNLDLKSFDMFDVKLVEKSRVIIARAGMVETIVEFVAPGSNEHRPKVMPGDFVTLKSAQSTEPEAFVAHVLAFDLKTEKVVAQLLVKGVKGYHVDASTFKNRHFHVRFHVDEHGVRTIARALDLLSSNAALPSGFSFDDTSLGQPSSAAAASNSVSKAAFNFISPKKLRLRMDGQQHNLYHHNQQQLQQLQQLQQKKEEEEKSRQSRDEVWRLWLLATRIAVMPLAIPPPSRLDDSCARAIIGRSKHAYDAVLNIYAQRMGYPRLASLGPCYPLLPPSLNDEQRKAILDIEARLEMPSSPKEYIESLRPYIIHGPPGTGKTMTLVHAIEHCIRRNPKLTVLACAPTDAAADVLATRLLKSSHLDKNSVKRVFSYKIPMQWYSTKLDISHASSRHVIDRVKGLIAFDTPDLEYDSSIRIVVTTCGTAGYLQYALRDPLHRFGLVVVDEASQVPNTNPDPNPYQSLYLPQPHSQSSNLLPFSL